MSIFNNIPFSDCNVSDHFFDSLKEDYPEFEDWFARKAKANERAYVFADGDIQAFLYIKGVEDEVVPDVLPKARRMKIGTLKIAEGSQGLRLGEGAIGIALWSWQQSDVDEIYVTVYPKHSILIRILESFGFVNAGLMEDGQLAYVKDKRKLRYETAKTSFPYLNPNFTRGKYIPINDDFHDKLFQYSELKNVKSSSEDATAASNGLSKVFIATPYGNINYAPGDIAVIYRIHTGDGPKRYKSVVTSYCTIVRQTPIKREWKYLKSLEEYLDNVRNKSVYTHDELVNKYKDGNNRNLVVIEMMYNGYFGSGNNVNYDRLEKSGLFNKYPYEIELSKDNVIEILGMGGKDVQDIIIDKPGAC